MRKTGGGRGLNGLEVDRGWDGTVSWVGGTLKKGGFPLTT